MTHLHRAVVVTILSVGLQRLMPMLLFNIQITVNLTMNRPIRYSYNTFMIISELNIILYYSGMVGLEKCSIKILYKWIIRTEQYQNGFICLRQTEFGFVESNHGSGTSVVKENASYTTTEWSV